MIERRRAVRVVLMRSTIHLVTARDCIALRTVVQPVIDRGLTGRVGRAIEGIDLEELASTGRALVESAPLTYSALGAQLAERWPERDPFALANAVRALVPLVQIPPRAVWGKSGTAAHTTVESWLGKPVARTAQVKKTVERYLAAFGPASVADAQAWSGLSRLREVFEVLRPRLQMFASEGGVELFDLPDAPRPDPDTEIEPRFLPEFDNALLSHADRTRIVTDEDRKRIATRNGMVPGAFLLDGFFRGAWKIVRAGKAATLLIEPYGRLLKREEPALVEEATRLLDFAAPGSESRRIEIARDT
jgi:hypothetical protein